MYAKIYRDVSGWISNRVSCGIWEKEVNVSDNTYKFFSFPKPLSSIKIYARAGDFEVIALSQQDLDKGIGHENISDDYRFRVNQGDIIGLEDTNVVRIYFKKLSSGDGIIRFYSMCADYSSSIPMFNVLSKLLVLCDNGSLHYFTIDENLNVKLVSSWQPSVAGSTPNCSCWISPSGRWIVLPYDGNTSTGRIYLLKFDGDSIIEIDNYQKNTFEDRESVRYSPSENRFIIFRSYNKSYVFDISSNSLNLIQQLDIDSYGADWFDDNHFWILGNDSVLRFYKINEDLTISQLYSVYTQKYYGGWNVDYNRGDRLLAIYSRVYENTANGVKIYNVNNDGTLGNIYDEFESVDITFIKWGYVKDMLLFSTAIANIFGHKISVVKLKTHEELAYGGFAIYAYRTKVTNDLRYIFHFDSSDNELRILKLENGQYVLKQTFTTADLGLPSNLNSGDVYG